MNASRYRWVALGLAFSSQLSNNLSSQAIAPLAPIFQGELGLTKAEVGFFSTAAFLGAWAVLLVAGPLTERFGVRVVMSLGQLLAGSLLLFMAVVGGLLEAVAVMFAVGLGRGAVQPGTTKAVADWFPPASRATAMGLKQSGFPVSGIITAALLPAVALTLGWRAATALVGVWIIGGGVAAALFYRDPRTAGESAGRYPGWQAGVSQVVRNRYLWVISLVGILLSTVQIALVTYLALYLVEVVLVDSVPDLSTRVVAAGWFLALCQVGGVAGRLLWGAVSDVGLRGRRMLMIAVLGGLTALLSAWAAFLGPATPLSFLALFVFLFGLAGVSYNGLYQTLVAETVGLKLAATGVGFSMSLVQAGTVFGAPLFGFVVDVTGGYKAAWLFMALIGAVGTLVAASTAGAEKRAG